MKIIALIGTILLAAGSSFVVAQPPGGPARDYGSASPSSRFAVQKGMRFERFRDRDGYQLRIHIRGMDPEAIQVSVRRRSLVVENRESHQIEQRNDRGGYQFATASSSMKRRIPLPPDADAGALQRSVEEGVVVITLPYAQGPRY